jgi:hypothetical protein
VPVASDKEAEDVQDLRMGRRRPSRLLETLGKTGEAARVRRGTRHEVIERIQEYRWPRRPFGRTCSAFSELCSVGGEGGV